MFRRAPLAATFALCALSWPHAANATGLTDAGDDLALTTDAKVTFAGYMRGRAEGLYNFDLDRGLLPSGRPLFPVSQASPKAQWLTHADMRLRADIAAYAPGGIAAVKIRADVLDNFGLGSMPEGIPYASLTQRPGSAAITVRRAYGEVLLPIGFLSFGRMGSHWGLGTFTNGGDCIDCESGDASDRISFVLPVLGHAFAFAYDFSATLAQVARPNNRAISIEPSTAVRSLTFAAMKFSGEDARKRRMKADKATVEYGVYGAMRTQDNDIPAEYIVSGSGRPGGSQQVIGRDYRAFAGNLWFKVTSPWVRFEAEATALSTYVGEPSLLAGVELRKPIRGLSIGAAFESDFGRPSSRIRGGLDGGYASGDKGAVLGAIDTPPRANRIDTFRFHPDYRIDRILFREIIGAVTNAIYVRPHAHVNIFKFASGELGFDAASVVSFTAAPQSSPSGKAPLGIELDPSLTYQGADGFLFGLDYGVLFPLGGLDNPAEKLSAKPAQSIRARIALRY
jgi:uncharacterized protein (TIGR04551 family)